MENVLLVDDEKNVLTSLRRLLSKDFYIFTATNAARGLEILKDTEIAVVVSDYRMPGMNGVEFLTEARTSSSPTIRILMTGQREDHIAIDAINNGHVYRFIHKPWNNDEMLLTVEQAIELYQLQRERRQLINEIHVKSAELEDINAHLEQKVEERTRQVLHADKMATLGQMAGQIGHEIKNVLALLKARVQLLQMKLNGGGDEEYRKNTFQELDRGINRLSNFASNLQSLGKSRDIHPEKLNLTDILHKTLSDLSDVGILKYYRVEESFEVQPAMVRADAGQLDQVFTNLLINAHHAMGRKGQLTVRIHKSDDSQSICTSITDTGCGISRAHMKKIFEPFFTTKQEGEGTGLGMPVVKQIVEAHGGGIQIESEEQKGTTVIVSLPCMDGQ